MGLLKPKHIYSYSQLSQFDLCPYSFYLARIERREQLENAFAQQGTLIHDLLDHWAKGDILAGDLSSEYAERYPKEVTAPWPKLLASKGYGDKAFQLGYDYFENFDEFQGFTVIDTEQKFETNIEGRPFVGIIDMLLRDNSTGEFIILDHKSKSATAFKKAQDEMYRQQLLYSKYIKEKYDIYPDRMMFNLFKENGQKFERPFTQQAYDEALLWAADVIHKIETFDEFDFLTSKEGDFFCQELCSVRAHCPNSEPVKKYKPRKKKSSGALL